MDVVLVWARRYATAYPMSWTVVVVQRIGIARRLIRQSEIHRLR